MVWLPLERAASWAVEIDALTLAVAPPKVPAIAVPVPLAPIVSIKYSAAETLPANHPAWALEAYYLAQAVCSVMYIISPRRVIFGGGVMHQPQLFPLLRQEIFKQINGYLVTPASLEEMATFIVPPGLGDDSGIRGALTLAAEVLKSA